MYALAVKVKTMHGISIGIFSVTLMSLMVFGAILPFSSSDTGTTNSVSLSVPVNEQIYVTAPYSSNFTILSVTGQGYSLTTAREFDSNILTFIPQNTSKLSVLLNVTSSGAMYAYVTKEASPVNLPACNNCNFTGQGSVLVQLNINATSGTSQVNSWDPLFGMLPVRLQGFSLSFEDVIATMAIFGSLFLGLGIAFRSKVSYLGVAVLFIVGAITIGLLVLLGVIGLYLLGFSLINIVWRYRSWRGRK